MGCNSVQIAIIVLIVIAVILMSVLIPLTFGSLEATEIGLDYDKTLIEIDETKLYANGRHAIGVSSYFIRYSTELATLNFDQVACRTKDGLKIWISAAYQYRLKNELQEILALFYSFPYDSYIEAYRKISRDVFRDVAAKYSAFQYVSNRSEIESQLRVNSQLKIDNYGSTIENFQLIDILFPQEFQDAIESAQNANLQEQTSQFNKSKATSEGIGQVSRAQVEKDVIINDASIEATTIKQAALSLKASIANRISQGLDSLSALQNQLNLGADDIISYVWGKSINELALQNQNSKLPVKIKEPEYITCFLTASACPS